MMCSGPPAMVPARACFYILPEEEEKEEEEHLVFQVGLSADDCPSWMVAFNTSALFKRIHCCLFSGKSFVSNNSGDSLQDWSTIERW